MSVLYSLPELSDQAQEYVGAILSSVEGLNGFELDFTVPDWNWFGRANVRPAELAQGLTTAAILGVALVLTFTPRNSNHVAAELRLEMPRTRYAFALLLALALVFVQNPTEFIYFIF